MSVTGIDHQKDLAMSAPTADRPATELDVPITAKAAADATPDDNVVTSRLGLRKFRDELPIPKVITIPAGADEHCAISIRAQVGRHRFHRDLPKTDVWAYEGQIPGPTIEVERDTPAAERARAPVRQDVDPRQAAISRHVRGLTDAFDHHRRPRRRGHRERVHAPERPSPPLQRARALGAEPGHKRSLPRAHARRRGAGAVLALHTRDLGGAGRGEGGGLGVGTQTDDDDHQADRPCA